MNYLAAARCLLFRENFRVKFFHRLHERLSAASAGSKKLDSRFC